MKQEIKVVVPKDWSGVTLRQYLALKKDMETYKDEPEAIIACLFHHLCNFPPQYLAQMDIDTYVAIKKDITQFLNNTKYPLKRFITIDGVEYGFEPNLSQMAYGAYVDISKYETLEINDKWSEIMSILYRPVIKKSGALYDIKTYDADINGDKFLDITMDAHWGAVFFFKDLLKDLQNSILKSLTVEFPEMDLHPRLKRILQESGEAIHQSYNWPVEISQKLMK